MLDMQSGPRYRPAQSSTSTDSSLPSASDVRLRESPELHPYKCEAAGIYCRAMTLDQLAAAGRARRCCRHYWAPAEDAA